ncbi:hypothetical protein D3C81_1585390 [compost metagenome]
MRDRADQGKAVAGACGPIHGQDHLAQRRQPVAVALHGRLDLACGARGEMQHRQIVGVWRVVDGCQAAAGHQGFIVTMARCPGLDGEEVLHAAKAARIARVTGISGPHDHHARRAVFHHVGRLGGGETRVQRGLDESGLV